MLCHGQGNETTDAFFGGCCYVDGAICPNRWYIEPHTPETFGTAIMRDHTGAELGTAEDAAKLFVGNSKVRRQRFCDTIQGTRYTCKAAVLAIDANPSILSNRAQFDIEWAARSEYAPIGSSWTEIGKPFNWCMIYGPDEGQCCYGESEEENQNKAAALKNTIVTIRRSATGAN